MKNLCIIGLGYVGLPLGLYASTKGYNVLGYDHDQKRVKFANSKQNFLSDEFVGKLYEKGASIKASLNPQVIKDADITIICVPTPVTEKHEPNFKPLISATEDVAKNAKAKSLIVVESTISPGTMENIVKPIIEKNYRIGRDIYLAHCPERIDPGNKNYNVSNIPRVLGAFSEKGLDMAYEFYSSLIGNNIRKMKSVREAEAVKILENSFRDINIAFINEIAKSFEKLKIDVMDVIEGAKTKPFGFMPYYPSCGVGGHCIPVDPYYLIERAEEKGFNHKFLKLAREINESMPKFTVYKFMTEMNSLGEAVKDKNIAVLGLAYKKNVSDTRESPSFKIIEQLKELGANVFIYDPKFTELNDFSNLDEIYKKCKYAIIATDHDEFRSLNLAKFKLILDARNMFYKTDVPESYRGLGR